MFGWARRLPFHDALSESVDISRSTGTIDCIYSGGSGTRETCQCYNADADMDAPSAQLHQELRNAVTEALSTRRPILHHLSADTAWLLQLPRPQQATRRGGRLYFNILIDPWLSGTQTDVTSWLSKQWHAVQPRVPNIAAVEELIREIEILANDLRLGKGRKSNAQEIEENGELLSFIDAVAISHEFTDHCHQQTLLQVHPDVPVFATEVRSMASRILLLLT